MLKDTLTTCKIINNPIPGKFVILPSIIIFVCAVFFGDEIAKNHEGLVFLSIIASFFLIVLSFALRESVGEGEVLIIEKNGVVKGVIKKQGSWFICSGKPHLKNISALEKHYELTIQDQLNIDLKLQIEVQHQIIDPIAFFSVSKEKESFLIKKEIDLIVRNLTQEKPFTGINNEKINDGRNELVDYGKKVVSTLKDDLNKVFENTGLIINNVELNSISYSDKVMQGLLKRSQVSGIVAAKRELAKGLTDVVTETVKEMAEKMKNENNCEMTEDEKKDLAAKLLICLSTEHKNDEPKSK